MEFLKEVNNQSEKEAVANRVAGVLKWVKENPEVNINPYETIDLALAVQENPSKEAKVFLEEIWEIRKANVAIHLLADTNSALYQMYETLIYDNPEGIVENKDFIQTVVHRNAWTRTAETENQEYKAINDGEWDELITLRTKVEELGVLDEKVFHLADCMIEEIYQTRLGNKFTNKEVDLEQFKR